MRAQLALVLVPWCPLLATRQMSPCRTLEGLNGMMCERLHTSAVIQKMQGGQKTPWHWRLFGSDAYKLNIQGRAARRLTAMPEVLPVQFKQMLCSNGVKLFLDLAVADECDGQHKQCCANDPQPEEPTSPIHCSNDAITIHANLHQSLGKAQNNE